MKNILVATDFSNNAYNALFHATQFFDGEATRFHLLNVYDEDTPLESTAPGKDLWQQLEDESREGLNAVYHKIRLDRSNTEHSFETISKKGNLAEVMVATIEENEIDLVIMGNSGCSEIKAIFMGSNVLKALAKIKKCPILTIPKEIDFKPIKEIAFVTDYKSTYDAKLLETLLFIAKHFKSKIRIMHINEEESLNKIQQSNRNILLEYLSDLDYTLNWMPLFKSKATAIHSFLKELNIDLLAMVNYEHSFLERVGREPVIKRMAFDLDIPFLVIPYED